MGSEHPDKPDYQVGDGCLVDQLMGQYISDVVGLGPLLDPKHIESALKAIYQYNNRRTLFEHESVQRTYVLNDEAALLICDYGTGKRPEIPFPYFAEAWTGLEYMAASQMIWAGMLREGVEIFENTRRRYDGERRNPWDEAECGHHYARAMSAWSGVVALSGFRYHAAEKSVGMTPRVNQGKFSCVWSAGTGWGTFSHTVENGRRRVTVAVAEGSLAVKTVALGAGPAGATTVTAGTKAVAHEVKRDASGTVFALAEAVTVKPGEELVIVG
jgi:hypothetical protein